MIKLLILSIALPVVGLGLFIWIVWKECSENPWIQDPDKEAQWRKENPHKADVW